MSCSFLLCYCGFKYHYSSADVNTHSMRRLSNNGRRPGGGAPPSVCSVRQCGQYCGETGSVTRVPVEEWRNLRPSSDHGSFHFLLVAVVTGPDYTSFITHHSRHDVSTALHNRQRGMMGIKGGVVSNSGDSCVYLL